MTTQQRDPKTGRWMAAQPLPFYYGLLPLMRRRLAGKKDGAFIGFSEGLMPALFADWHNTL